MNPENTLCLIIDIQERLLPALHDKDDMLHHSRILIQGLHALGVPFAVTEQYPKGLGKTVPAVSLLLPETTPFIEKTRFSALSPETHAILTQAAVQNIILIGAETHICMLQTVLDLRLEGFNVYVPFECIPFPRKQRKRAGANARSPRHRFQCGKHFVPIVGRRPPPRLQNRFQTDSIAC